MRTRRDIALAISTACWKASGRSPTTAPGSIEKPSSSSRTLARARSVRAFTRPGSSPRKMFSATVSSEASASSW